MGGFSPIHWIILGIIVLILFGGSGKISSFMGEFAKGIKSFKKNMDDEEPQKSVETKKNGPTGEEDAKMASTPEKEDVTK